MITTEKAERILESIKQQYNNRTLQRNMSIVILKMTGVSGAEIAQRYHLSRQRVNIILQQWEELRNSLREGQNEDLQSH
jgi:transposase